MANARQLLEIAAEFVEATKSTQFALAMGGTPADDLDEIAGRWERALQDYLRQQ